jgi:hypothetical protein
MAHAVCPEEISDIGAWLGERLKKGSDQFSGKAQDAGSK